MQTIVCEHLHQPGGWLSPGTLHVDGDGMITRVERGASGQVTVRLDGWVIPGMANVHSHAFQRALVGLTERADPARADSFWTWRVEMYRLALAIEPEDISAIAAQLYVEMLEAGMTAVGEFHYLHHDRDGSPYPDRAETSHRIVAAARKAGIGLTLLPVLYMKGGFDSEPMAEQRRFIHGTVGEFVATLETLAVPEQPSRLVRLGFAAHSLRAVVGDALREVVSEIRARDSRAPIHIHIAEQKNEVDQAVPVLGDRPVRWLVGQFGDELDERWCLVHSTHVDPGEVALLASSGVVVGLCPTTEANLGDGVFPAVDFVARGGKLAIGSDSHVTVSAIDELRTLEYGQRLVKEQRNLLTGNDEHHVGRFLFDRAARSGADALDQPIGALVPGRRADLVALDADHPRLVGHGPDTVLDAWIFGTAHGAVRDVFVAGQQRVNNGAHLGRQETAAQFARSIKRLRGL
ncbi:MAG: formimidoylglutamate deiminase [Proteobacteria bacterium]|nr:formimidoylglutamate deiminase [Pseudomonadota bacterium]